MWSIKVECNGHAERIGTGFHSMHEFCVKNIGPKCDMPEFVHARRLPRPYVMVIDESGLYHNLEVNPVGCKLYQTDLHGCPIVGDVLFLKDVMTLEGPDYGYLDERDLVELVAILTKYGARFSESENRKEGE